MSEFAPSNHCYFSQPFFGSLISPPDPDLFLQNIDNMVLKTAPLKVKLTKDDGSSGETLRCKKLYVVRCDILSIQTDSEEKVVQLENHLKSSTHS